MAHNTAPSPAQRVAVLGGVFALHVALLVVVLATRGAREPDPPKPALMSVISLPAEQAAKAPPPPPTLPSKLAETNRPLTEFVAAEEVDPNSTAAAGGGCATLEQVSKGLLADPLAIEALLRAPPETRSIADAIVVWNAGWSEAASAPEAPLGAVRTSAEASLRKLEDGCLDEAVAGPRLIPVPAGSRTLFVVIGSGNWRWRDLLAEEEKPRPESVFDWLDL